MIQRKGFIDAVQLETLIEFERSIAWSDPAIGIQSPLENDPSAKDKQGKPVVDAECFA